MNTANIQLPSNRKFGLFFSAVFAVCCVYNIWHDKSLWAGIFGALAAVTLVVTLSAPDRLTPFNKVWAYIGLLLGKIINPIVMAIIFFGLVTPTAAITRLFGRDELRLKRTNGISYWRQRSAQSTEHTSFRNQY